MNKGDRDTGLLDDLEQWLHLAYRAGRSSLDVMVGRRSRADVLIALRRCPVCGTRWMAIDSKMSLPRTADHRATNSRLEQCT